MDTITSGQLDALKSRFRGAGYSVADVDDESFEIADRDFPVRTHISVTPYYVQLGTFIAAIPQGFMPGRKSKRDAFLQGINLRAKVVRFTVEADKPDDEDGHWLVLADLKLITGATGADHDEESLRNVAALWYQDIAALMASPSGFVLHAMMREESV